MDNRPIGVFDSGVGGLSVLIELKKVLPNENFIFLADQKNVPYGEKTKEELETLTSRISQFLVDQGAKLIVVACNTATCYAIDALRRNFSLPFVGTVPAIKSAALATKTGVIGLIATPATAESDYVKELSVTHAAGKKVLSIGCRGLEDLVEEGDLRAPEVRQLLEKYLEPIQKAGADQLVLGCTHYPFLRSVIEDIIGPRVAVLDSGLAIARRTALLLDERSLCTGSTHPGSVRYFTTLDPKKFDLATNALLGIPVSSSSASI